MTFWQGVEHTAGTSPGQLPWLVVGFLAVVALLGHYLPAERPRLRGALFLFVLAFAGLLAAGALLRWGPAASGGAGGSPGYVWLAGVSQFLHGVALINVASVLIFAVLLHVARLEPSRIAQDLLVALAYVVVGILLLSRNGVDLRGIVATSAVITAVIGFSLQDTLGNVMGGMALQMERTIQAGDWIRVDEVEGRVKEIRWRQTSIETRDWDTIVIPNSVLMKGRVRVLGRRMAAPLQRRQWVYFNVDFRTSPTEVIEVVERELRAESLPLVAASPEPHCLMTGFQESYAAYAVRYWLTDLANADPTDSLVRTRIYAALRRAGIPLSIPAQSVFVTEDNASLRERKRGEELDRRLGTLARLELFKALTDDERRSLAHELNRAPFVRGETITHQGAVAHWLYILIEGEAEVQVTVDDTTRKVAKLGSGDFFGEMGMMTGEPRASTVIALTDVDCYRLGPDCFRDILRRRPEIAEAISHTLARRRLELEGVREEVTAAALRERLHHTQGTLLRRLREAFGLGGGGGGEEGEAPR